MVGQLSAKAVGQGFVSFVSNCFTKALTFVSYTFSLIIIGLEGTSYSSCFQFHLLHITGYCSSLPLQSIQELTAVHDSVIKVVKAEMNFLIVSLSDKFKFSREMEPFLEFSK